MASNTRGCFNWQIPPKLYFYGVFLSRILWWEISYQKEFTWGNEEDQSSKKTLPVINSVTINDGFVFVTLKICKQVFVVGCHRDFGCSLPPFFLYGVIWSYCAAQKYKHPCIIKYHTKLINDFAAYKRQNKTTKYHYHSKDRHNKNIGCAFSLDEWCIFGISVFMAVEWTCSQIKGSF